MYKQNEPNKFDWKQLELELVKNSIRNKRIVAVAPKFAPPKVLRNLTEGIEPIRDMKRSQKYFGLGSENNSQD